MASTCSVSSPVCLPDHRHRKPSYDTWRQAEDGPAPSSRSRNPGGSEEPQLTRAAHTALGQESSPGRESRTQGAQTCRGNLSCWRRPRGAEKGGDVRHTKCPAGSRPPAGIRPLARLRACEAQSPGSPGASAAEILRHSRGFLCVLKRKQTNNPPTHPASGLPSRPTKNRCVD